MKNVRRKNVNINIAITPGSSNHIIDIKFNMMQIKIRKHRSSGEPVGNGKSKHVRKR